MKAAESLTRMEIRAPVSRMERAVCRVEVGGRGEGIRALECRRASLAVERSFCAVDGLVCKACWREWRRLVRSGVEEELVDMADGML